MLRFLDFHCLSFHPTALTLNLNFESIVKTAANCAELQSANYIITQ